MEPMKCWFHSKISFKICLVIVTTFNVILEKEMVTLSSILALEIPWTEEPGGLQSMGLQRVGHD